MDDAVLFPDLMVDDPVGSATPGSSKKNTILMGQAGEYLVAAELSALGHEVFLGPEGSRTDLIVSTDFGLLRVQVKLRSSVKRKRDKGRRKKGNWCGYSYRFRSVPRSSSRHKEVAYTQEEVDVFALVIWPHRCIYFMPNNGESGRCFSRNNHFGSAVTESSWQSCLSTIFEMD